jgi:hypothetical protein
MNIVSTTLSRGNAEFELWNLDFLWSLDVDPWNFLLCSLCPFAAQNPSEPLYSRWFQALSSSFKRFQVGGKGASQNQAFQPGSLPQQLT